LRSLGQGKGNKEEQSEAPKQGFFGSGFVKNRRIETKSRRTPFTEI